LAHVRENDVALYKGLLEVNKVCGHATSNGNDIETKQNDISIIGEFSVSKQNNKTNRLIPEL
jgi:hypothetical protein